MATKRPISRLFTQRSTPALCRRRYHSYDHPAPASPFNKVETDILTASFPYVSTHGFTAKALALGAKDAGYIDASVNLFPKGAFSLVQWHLLQERLALAEKSGRLDREQKEDTNAKPLGVAAKVKWLTWERLMGNKEVIHQWQEVNKSTVLRISTL